jgi:hypothetical protein
MPPPARQYPAGKFPLISIVYIKHADLIKRILT